MSSDSNVESRIKASMENAESDNDSSLEVEGSSEIDSPLVYKIEWEDDIIGRRQDFRSKFSFGPLEIATEDVDKPESVGNTTKKPAIEVVTRIWGVLTPVAPDTWPDEMKSPSAKSKRIKLQDINIGKVDKTRLIIHSQPLLKALRECVKYFPGQTLTADNVELIEPYPILIHHLDELEGLQNQLDSNNETCKHLKILLEYLKNNVVPLLSLAMENLRKPIPTVAFDDLWLLFKPGLDIYRKFHVEHFSDVTTAAVLMVTEYGDRHDDQWSSERKRLTVKFWSLQSDGQTLGRDVGRRYIDQYEGERQVTSLLVYPCKYLDSEDRGETRKSLVERGRKMYKLLRGMPSQMWCDGYHYATPKEVYRGHCIVDTRTALSTQEYMRDRIHDFLEEEITPQSSDTDMGEQSLSEFIFAAFHKIQLAETPILPSDRHYFLCQPLVPGFALDDKTWKTFNVEWLSEIVPSGSMEGLFIDPVNEAIIQAITHSHYHHFKLDAVQNKGAGQVVLLHGPPGVGKTYSVECIAQSTGRPLIALTMNDLLDGRDEIDEKLQKWFTLAEHWNSILLLDEADIFLERRITRDIERNAIVSVFLRRLEYFSGLLFLTTNRVGQIDDAILSRVSVVLPYDHLSDETRKKIWRSFFAKVRRESDLLGTGKVEINKYAQQYMLNDPKVRDLQWNGREIRNALQMAIMLARHRALKEDQAGDTAVEVEEEHFQSVVTMSLKFKEYMKSISGKGEAGRAKARLDRANPENID